MKKTTSVEVSKNALKKIIEIKTKATTAFTTVTETDVIDAVFSKSVNEIVSFVNSSRTREIVEKSVERKVRRKKHARLPKSWRESKVKELSENKKAIVKTVKEAHSLYNHFKLSGKGSVTYHTKKRGGIEVILKPMIKPTVKRVTEA